MLAYINRYISYKAVFSEWFRYHVRPNYSRKERNVCMKLSVCIDAVFAGKNRAESLRALNAAGIGAFEFWSWWDKDTAELKRTAQELGLTVAAFCTKMVSLADPARREEYLRGLEESVGVAQYLGCRSLITQVGGDTGCSRESQHRSIVEGLRASAGLLEPAGVTLLVEPLNTKVDHPGYYLSSSLEGFDIIGEVGSPNVKLLFDLYHQQITEGNLTSNIVRNIGKIGHFHAAGVPGRHEPGSGELNYRYLFERIDRAGFQGFMGLEYFPAGDPAEGLRALVRTMPGAS